MLETEIKRLSDNIEHLNKLLETMADMAKANATSEPAPTPKVETKEADSPTPEVENEQGYTTDDIKSMALAISRKDRSKQKEIKAKLAEYDAKVANELKGDGLQAVGEWLSASKEEMGA